MTHDRCAWCIDGERDHAEQLANHFQSSLRPDTMEDIDRYAGPAWRTDYFAQARDAAHRIGTSEIRFSREHIRPPMNAVIGMFDLITKDRFDSGTE